MKKILFSAVSALAVAGVAVAADSTEFGVLTVPSSAVETIVSVPWLASGTGSDSVKVADIVLTSGLNVGDELKYYNNGTYQCWKLVQDSTTGVKSWEAATNLDANSEKIDNPAADTATLARGQAIVLKRGGTIASKFYIMGKPTADGVKTVLGAGYSLVAPPSVAETDVNAGITWTNINPNDKIMIPSTSSTSIVTLSYVNNAWCKWQNKQWVSTGIKIPAGTGAWFVNSGLGEGEKSFTFGTVSK